MKFTGQFVWATIDRKDYERDLKEALRVQLMEVAKAWLAGVTGRIPVWSGMSRGSLLALTELVNGTLVISPRDGVASRIIEGRSLGTAKWYKNLKDFKIVIETNVPHYNLQEYTNVGISKSAPWGSLEAGMAAAKLVSNNVRLPRITLKRHIEKL